ncbi:Filamentation induced by cAMP protein Fic [Desulfamplus magnetovallimortis]|uniref:Filamentation induced by cAMP protein Fic n=1 Tax=Desulfamplus magnetovallimortis TaxID=1246637 RepID=A0A1W1HHM8_9BACT|nr:Fic family protein [Desulfamplus magnetovallimortis]SLM31946.1 Filamentation induced by cAMP protein Fic [Desulfamplus magnetovallimortis]
MSYIWQHPSWPEFTWNSDNLLKHLGKVRFAQGSLLTKIRELGFDLQENTRADILVEEVFHTSAIEGEVLDWDAIRSSVGRKLGVPRAGVPDKRDQKADLVVDILLDATMNYNRTLAPDHLWSWHAALFPTGYSGLLKIITGAWRDDIKGPMQVVSGAMGREKIHYEALPATNIEQEISTFLSWVNDDNSQDGILKAGIAHFWFVTIHPFDDGNGRIARTITDMMLARDEDSARRLYSLSSQIMLERNDYYDILETTQKGSGDITDWLKWFLECMHRAIIKASKLVENSLIKARFWKEFAMTTLNERQIKVINRLLDAGHKGFQGGLKNKKYMGIAHTSRATAQRDISDLVKKGILTQKNGGGRSVNYDIDWKRWLSD